MSWHPSSNCNAAWTNHAYCPALFHPPQNPILSQEKPLILSACMCSITLSPFTTHKRLPAVSHRDHWCDFCSHSSCLPPQSIHMCRCTAGHTGDAEALLFRPSCVCLDSFKRLDAGTDLDKSGPFSPCLCSLGAVCELSPPYRHSWYRFFDGRPLRPNILPDG